MATVRSLAVTVHEVVALDEQRVLAIYTERRLNEGDPAPVELDIGIVHEFTGEKITRMEVYTGHANARRAAGVAEDTPAP